LSDDVYDLLKRQSVWAKRSPLNVNHAKKKSSL